MTVTDNEVKNTMFLQALMEYHHLRQLSWIPNNLWPSGFFLRPQFQIYDLDQPGTYITVNNDLLHSRIVMYVAELHNALIKKY